MNERRLFPRSHAGYAAARDALLERIAQGLQADGRVIAAWLAGSFGRGEQDDVSDIDLFVVVDDDAAADLCARSRMTSAGSLPERLALFSAFGEPANLHENHNNAPAGGSFTAVLYASPPVVVDWTLVPFAMARRPFDTRLLFERESIPLDQPPAEEALTPEERAARLAERDAFFWMLAAVTAKYIQRGSHGAAAKIIAYLEETLDELANLLERELEWPAQAGGQAGAAQAAYLRALCELVEALGLPSEPRAQVEAILNLTRSG